MKKLLAISWLEPDMCRYEELLDEIRCRIRAIDRYAENVDAGWMDIDSSIVLPGYHPEIY